VVRTGYRIGLCTAEKLNFGCQKADFRAKARLILRSLTARLKSCPSLPVFLPSRALAFPKPREKEFSAALLGMCMRSRRMVPCSVGENGSGTLPLPG
jgi:hypothetical protein